MPFESKEMDLINNKSLNISLIENKKYKVEDSILIYKNEDIDSYLFENDSIIIKLPKSIKIAPLYNLGDLVNYNSDVYQVKEIDSNYDYILYKEIGLNKSILLKTELENLTELSNTAILRRFSSKQDIDNYTDLPNIIIDSSITTNNDVSMLVESTISKHMKSSYCCKCCYDDHNSYNLITSLKAIHLKPDYKYILINRYIKSLVYHENQITQINGVYHAFRFFIQTGSILTPALLSIQHLIDSNQPNFIYWVTWVVSLMVGLLTNYISLFGLDKKFFTYEKNYHILVSHGWQYLQLSGKYGKQKDSLDLPTHENMFNRFCGNIETLLLNEATSIAQSIKDKGDPIPKTPRLKSNKLGRHDIKNK